MRTRIPVATTTEIVFESFAHFFLAVHFLVREARDEMVLIGACRKSSLAKCGSDHRHGPSRMMRSFARNAAIHRIHRDAVPELAVIVAAAARHGFISSADFRGQRVTCSSTWEDTFHGRGREVARGFPVRS